MKPRMPYSPPATPTITLSFTACGPGVERDEVGVERAHEDPIAERREAAVLRTAAERQVLRQIPLVVPERTPGADVHGVRVIVRRREIHDAVDHERRGLVPAAHAGLEHPLQGKPLH